MFYRIDWDRAKIGILKKPYMNFETGNVPNNNKIAIICEMLQNIGIKI